MKNDFVVHSGQEICGIREAAEIAASVRDRLVETALPGMSTREYDLLAGAMISSSGAKSAFLGYRGFPGQVCISVNDEVVHGYGKPDRILREGDLVSIDVGVNIRGFIGDTASSFIVGGNGATEDAVRLLKTTEKALWAGIVMAKVGFFVSDISAAVEKIAKSDRLGVVRDYVGHGVGTELHEPPEIPNFTNGRKGPKLRPGMVLAIEPMLNLGTHAVYTEKDGWTVRTKDARLSAHFEHMVLVTESEPEVMTWRRK